MTDTEELPAACETVSSPIFVTLLLQLSAAPVLNCFSLCDPMDCSLPGSSVRGILQARILEWLAISFSRDLPDPGIKPEFPAYPALAGGLFTTEPLGSPDRGLLFTKPSFSCCSWGSQGKNTEVVCHSLLQGSSRPRD